MSGSLNDDGRVVVASGFRRLLLFLFLTKFSTVHISWK